MVDEIVKLLPGYNCGSCGYNNCADFGNYIISNPEFADKCPILSLEKYKGRKKVILEKIAGNSKTGKAIAGVLDSYVADIVLSPVSGEISCREVLLFLVPVEVVVGDIIRYRPLGCPIIHFAKVLEKEGLLITVHIVGPNFKVPDTLIKDLGKCLVMGFEGICKGGNVKVGQTIRFLPEHCMMQKVHSGVVVDRKDNTIRIEGVDLKVWSPPEMKTAGL